MYTHLTWLGVSNRNNFNINWKKKENNFSGKPVQLLVMHSKWYGTHLGGYILAVTLEISKKRLFRDSLGISPWYNLIGFSSIRQRANLVDVHWLIFLSATTSKYHRASGIFGIPVYWRLGNYRRYLKHRNTLIIEQRLSATRDISKFITKTTVFNNSLE